MTLVLLLVLDSGPRMMGAWCVRGGGSTSTGGCGVYNVLGKVSWRVATSEQDRNLSVKFVAGVTSRCYNSRI